MNHKTSMQERLDYLTRQGKSFHNKMLEIEKNEVVKEYLKNKALRDYLVEEIKRLKIEMIFEPLFIDRKNES